MTKMLKIFETNPYLANPDHDEMKKKKLDKEMKTLTRMPEEINGEGENHDGEKGEVGEVGKRVQVL